MSSVCPIALLTEKRKTTMTVIWEIVYRSGLEKYKKFFSTYKKIIWCNISIVTENFAFIHCSMICFSSFIEFFLFFHQPKSSCSLPNSHALLKTLSYISLTFFLLQLRRPVHFLLVVLKESVEINEYNFVATM